MMAYNDVNFTCCVCGIAITMPEGLYQQRVTDHGEFYCVNGHRQRFTQKDKKEQEIARLREEVRARDSLIETFRSEANELWDEREGLIALLRECPLCDWRSSKRIPRGGVRAGVERVHQQLVDHLAHDHGLPVPQEQRLLEAGA